MFSKLSGAPRVAGLTVLIAGFSLLLTTAATRAQEESVRPGINNNFQDADVPQFVERFEREGREVYDGRDKLIQLCKLKPGMRVADVGAGTGLFTRLFAEAVGPEGKVLAVDISANFLKHIEQSAREAKLANIETILCNQRDSKLPEQSVDRVFICDTYHHFEFPERTMKSIHRALRPGGQVILVDFKRVPGQSSEWILSHVRAGQETVVEEVQKAGFKVVGQELLLKDNYILRLEAVR